MIFRLLSIVKVPFPFTEQNKVKKRPALVLSSERFQQKNGCVVLAMVTTAKKSSWWGDCEIQDLLTAGLPTQSVVRPKIFTLDCGLVVGLLGALSDKDAREVRKTFKEIGLVDIW